MTELVASLNPPELVCTQKRLMRSLSWLHALCKFCDELRDLASMVPDDADAEEMTDIPDIVYSHAQSFPMLLACNNPLSCIRSYEHDIQGEICAPIISMLHQKACVAYKTLAQHAVLGRFRPDRPHFFYERTLSICMSVAIQHLQDLPAIWECNVQQANEAVQWPLSSQGSFETMCVLLNKP